MDASKLEGAELDLAVARAEGWTDAQAKQIRYRPSTDWAIAGPIIERHEVMISLDYTIDGWDHATWRARTIETIRDGKPTRGVGFGPTPLIAAMRAFVASKEQK